MRMRNCILQNCFAGNSHIHQMSINGSHELSVLLVKKNGIKAYANYSKFSVGDEQSQFLLHITNYHGDAGKIILENHMLSCFNTIVTFNSFIFINKRCFDINWNVI